VELAARSIQGRRLITPGAVDVSTSPTVFGGWIPRCDFAPARDVRIEDAAGLIDHVPADGCNLGRGGACFSHADHCCPSQVPTLHTADSSRPTCRIP
jgi:hypothetical protein